MALRHTPKIISQSNFLSNYLIKKRSKKLHRPWALWHNQVATFVGSVEDLLNFSRKRGKLQNEVLILLYIYIYMSVVEKNKFESYFRDRLIFSNVDSRTSRRIYRLALLLRAPETLSSLSKSRISIFNAHLTLLVRKMTSHNSIGKYHHLVN